jgi:hypothetical protein
MRKPSGRTGRVEQPMSEFAKIEPFLRVHDESRAFMMVPAGGFNLVAHVKDKGAVLQPAKSLSMLDVTDPLQRTWIRPRLLLSKV